LEPFLLLFFGPEPFLKTGSDLVERGTDFHLELIMRKKILVISEKLYLKGGKTMHSKSRRLFSLLALILGFTLLFLAVGSVSIAQDRFNTTIAKLKAGQPAFGIFSWNRDIYNARVLGNSKLDYIIYDAEHGQFAMENFRQFLESMKTRDGKFKVTPFIRIGPNGSEVKFNQWVVKQALDMGAMGIMVPHVDTKQQAYDAVVSMRYPPRKESPYKEPRGERGFGPGIAAGTWGIRGPEYAKKHADLWPLNPDGELLLIVQVESKMAVENLEEILSVPGVGAVYIGPGDLQCDLGYCGAGMTMPGVGAPPASTIVPEAEELIQRALSICKRRNVPVGIWTSSLDAVQRVKQGFNLPTIGTDVGITADTAKALGLLGR
jgi:4-hydroxy-2-oxoheptanedioate aldolase